MQKFGALKNGKVGKDKYLNSLGREHNFRAVVVLEILDWLINSLANVGNFNPNGAGLLNEA